MAQGPSVTILVAIRITLRIRESKVRNPDPPDRRRFVLSECISCYRLCYFSALDDSSLNDDISCSVLWCYSRLLLQHSCERIK